MNARIVSITLFLVACTCLAFTLAPTETASPAPAPSAMPVWQIDLRTAVREAGLLKRPVLVWFSASGWNDASDRLEKRLRDPAFVIAAAERAVLVNIDFPDASSADAAGQRSTAMAVRFGVSELPALVMLDSTGRPVARLSEGKNADDVLASLDQAIATRSKYDTCIAAAGDVSTLDELNQLDAALELVKPYATEWYSDQLARVTTCPLEGAQAIRTKWTPAMAEGSIDRIIQSEVYPLADAGQFDTAIGRVDALLNGTNMSPSQRQLITALKGQLYYSKNDRAAALALLDSALAIDPAGPNADRVRAARAQFDMAETQN
jgi:tetratricopeptide (TPR) repeat protein